jgi:hypothetical protein
MAKKALGIEIKEFLKNGFPEEFIHEFDESGDSDLELEEVLIDNEVYDLSDSMIWLKKLFPKLFLLGKEKRL